jgi:hypothetical protein
VTKRPERTYTVEEFAEAWGRTPRTVYRWLVRGDLIEGRDYERASTPGQPAGAYRLKASAMPPKGYQP